MPLRHLSRWVDRGEDSRSNNGRFNSILSSYRLQPYRVPAGLRRRWPLLGHLPLTSHSIFPKCSNGGYQAQAPILIPTGATTCGGRLSHILSTRFSLSSTSFCPYLRDACSHPCAMSTTLIEKYMTPKYCPAAKNGCMVGLPRPV